MQEKWSGTCHTTFGDAKAREVGVVHATPHLGMLKQEKWSGTCHTTFGDAKAREVGVVHAHHIWGC